MSKSSEPVDNNSTADKPCKTCNDRGWVDDTGKDWRPCPDCSGTGKAPDQLREQEEPVTPANNPNPTCRKCWDKGYASYYAAYSWTGDFPGDPSGRREEYKNIYCTCDKGRAMAEAAGEALPNEQSTGRQSTPAALPNSESTKKELEDIVTGCISRVALFQIGNKEFGQSDFNFEAMTTLAKLQSYITEQKIAVLEAVADKGHDEYLAYMNSDCEVERTQAQITTRVLYETIATLKQGYDQ